MDTKECRGKNQVKGGISWEERNLTQEILWDIVCCLMGMNWYGYGYYAWYENILVG